MSKSLNICFFVIACISFLGMNESFAHRKPPFQLSQPNQYNEQEEGILEGVEETHPGDEAEEESQ